MSLAADPAVQAVFALGAVFIAGLKPLKYGM
jgi:hypothetical protein